MADEVHRYAAHISRHVSLRNGGYYATLYWWSSEGRAWKARIKPKGVVSRLSSCYLGT